MRWRFPLHRGSGYLRGLHHRVRRGVRTGGYDLGPGVRREHASVRARPLLPRGAASGRAGLPRLRSGPRGIPEVCRHLGLSRTRGEVPDEGSMDRRRSWRGRRGARGGPRRCRTSIAVVRVQHPRARVVGAVCRDIVPGEPDAALFELPPGGRVRRLPQPGGIVFSPSALPAPGQ